MDCGKKERRTVFAVGLVLLLLFTFTDLQISMAVAQKPLWARIFEVVGEIPFTTLTIAACANEIDKLEQSKSAVATLWSLILGMIGTVFMAGSVFAVTHEPPIYWLCVLLAVPGFLGWTFPYFVYRHKVMSQAKKIQPIIEAKQDEIYEICKKGHDLL